MEEVTDLDHQTGNGQLNLQIATEEGEHEIKGFESLFLDHIDKILDSDFEEDTLFFRDQPYQKLKMSKKDEDILKLRLHYPDRAKSDTKMEVGKERFKNFLERVKDSLSD